MMKLMRLGQQIQRKLLCEEFDNLAGDEQQESTRPPNWLGTCCFCTAHSNSTLYVEIILQDWLLVNKLLFAQLGTKTAEVKY